MARVGGIRWRDVILCYHRKGRVGSGSIARKTGVSRGAALANQPNVPFTYPPPPRVINSYSCGTAFLEKLTTNDDMDTKEAVRFRLA